MFNISFLITSTHVEEKDFKLLMIILYLFIYFYNSWWES